MIFLKGRDCKEVVIQSLGAAGSGYGNAVLYKTRLGKHN